MSDKYPFYTDDVDGQTVTGAAYYPRSATFREFADPATHDAHIALRDPRTGEVTEYDTPGAWMLARATAGIIYSRVPADRWAEFRDDYQQATDERVSAAEADMRQVLGV